MTWPKIDHLVQWIYDIYYIYYIILYMYIAPLQHMKHKMVETQTGNNIHYLAWVHIHSFIHLCGDVD